MIVTLAVLLSLQPVAVEVINTEYVPLIAAVAFVIVGFCSVEAKPLGPVHEYVTGDDVLDDVRLIVAPSQNTPAPGPVITGIAVFFTSTKTVLDVEQPLEVTVNV